MNDKEISGILEITKGIDDLLEVYSLLLAQRKLSIEEVRDHLLDFYLDVRAENIINQK